jgi:hypothetical protein
MFDRDGERNSPGCSKMIRQIFAFDHAALFPLTRTDRRQAQTIWR